MKTIVRTIAVSSLGLLLAAGVAGHARAQGGADAVPQPMIGTAAPDFELKTVAGDRLSLRDLRGQYLVIHFGTSW